MGLFAGPAPGPSDPEASFHPVVTQRPLPCEAPRSKRAGAGWAAERACGKGALDHGRITVYDQHGRPPGCLWRTSSCVWTTQRGGPCASGRPHAVVTVPTAQPRNYAVGIIMLSAGRRLADAQRACRSTDASWKCPMQESPTLDQLAGHRVLAVDLNAGHVAAMVVDGSGNPVGRPLTIPLTLNGLPATTRDGHLRAAISSLIALAKEHGCQAVVIENLDFKDARELGRERGGHRPSRGRRGKHFRRTVSGIPTAKFGDRLVQMAANAGLSVIAVDPAYTSKWGAEHWLGHLKEISADASGHHAAAFVIARRGLRQRARQRRRCDSTPAEHGEKRATRPVVRSKSVGHPAVLSEQRMRDTGTHGARGQSHLRRKTRPAERTAPVDQVAQDRSGSPARRDSVPLSVEERFEGDRSSRLAALRQCGALPVQNCAPLDSGSDLDNVGEVRASSCSVIAARLVHRPRRG